MKYLIHQLNRKSHSTNFQEIWNVPNPPLQLFAQGTLKGLALLQQLPERGLAIVGTRNPLPISISFVEKRLAELSGSNLIILSGLARGIDSAAHRGALQAKLPTIALLGTGLDSNYPQENRSLREQILLSDGLLVSEFPPGKPTFDFHFLQRNRLIASWSKATWIVEASHRSGSLNTAKWARDRDRVCFTLPCFPGNPAFAGNQRLLDEDQALPFWGIHSLGAAWIEFATYCTKKTAPKNKIYSMNLESNALSPTVEALVRQVRAFTYQKGGAEIQEVFDWAISQGWEPEIFFTLLKKAIQGKKMMDQQGKIFSSIEND